jgi:hypothetical protein
MRNVLVELADTLPLSRDPRFVPNPTLGEGVATPQELEYRQELLDVLAEFRAYVYDILHSGYSVGDMKRLLDNATSSFITDSHEVVDRQINNVYNLSRDQAGAALNQLGLSSLEDNIDRTRIDMLITQQKDNLEAMAFDIRNRIRKQINLAKVADFYGSKSE